MSRNKLMALGLVGAVAIAGCGSAEPAAEELREDPTSLDTRGKADVPDWVRHIPEDFYCDATIAGQFSGYDSAHAYSFPGKVGYEYVFSFQANYPRYRGAAIAVFDAETGDRVALARRPGRNAARVTYRAERNVKYIVAVYSIWWWATGDYTLSAECTLRGCKADGDCGPTEYCAQQQCGQTGSGLGVCSVKPDACPRVYMPVCGCDGNVYGNECQAAMQGVSVAHKGTCPTITLDARQTTTIETIEATFNNNAAPISADNTALYLAGCSAYEVERLEAGQWVSHGSTRVCFWEGYAQKVEPGQSHTETVGFPEAGTWRVSARYGVGCQDNQPLSQANCTSFHQVVSDEVAVSTQSCSGAWLDQFGNCRGPADGVLPETCCAQEREQRCNDIAGAYSEAIATAKQCSPWVTAPQCQDLTSTSLPCGGCAVYINQSREDAGLEAIADEWQQMRCPTMPWMCPAYMCPAPTGSVCEIDAASPSGGTCVTLRD